jgi:hypothetical protein
VVLDDVQSKSIEPGEKFLAWIVAPQIKVGTDKYILRLIGGVFRIPSHAVS